MDKERKLQFIIDGKPLDATNESIPLSEVLFVNQAAKISIESFFEAFDLYFKLQYFKAVEKAKASLLKRNFYVPLDLEIDYKEFVEWVLKNESGFYETESVVVTPEAILKKAIEDHLGLEKFVMQHLDQHQPILENAIQDDNKVIIGAKHHVLAYIFDCHAKGESLPIGEKKKLEQIGNKRIGKRKGNRFYRVFGNIACLDLNIENKLIDIAGENWRNIVLELAENPELVEDYLKSKHL